ncbi:hypothetical protein GCM10011371_05860 [Novosphingobium marinum]|uniref:Tetratricopeptide repeat protein n=1 Tax=Novosphingobium marinum TaxID=1514948 RepID=A0A7Y9XTH2_9SPHN|nr:hypothetical protein [Novosphingobium marinum]NYH94274.1 hypothetical protein [Novosphingobium marinum]GGC21027.1 hypothetical protein GCM10011371_05860 [Novosphingobium marinum]
MIRHGKLKFGKLVSRSALGAALAFGVVAGGATISTPAYAQKGFSKPFVAAAQPVQEGLGQIETQKNSGADVSAAVSALKPQVEAAAAAASTPKDMMTAGQFLLNLGTLGEDMMLRQRGVQMILDSGQLEAAKVPQFQYYLGNFAYSNKEYATAASALKAAKAGGYSESNLVPLMLQSYADAGQPAQAIAALKELIATQKAAGQPVPADWTSRGSLIAYKANMGKEAAELATMQAQADPTPLNWLNAAQMTRSFNQFDGQISLDLFRLMDRSGALDADAQYTRNEYKEYIETADPRRFPGEVVRIIDKGVSKGALDGSEQWIKESRQTASGRVASDKASLSGDVASAKSNGRSAQALADAFLNYGDAAQAEELYAAALSAGGQIDRDLIYTRMGIAQLDQGKIAEAKDSFTKVNGSRAPVANLWLAYAETQA